MVAQRRKFTAVDRTTIALRLRDGWGIRRIARALGRSPGTVSDEVNRNGGHAVRKALMPKTVVVHWYGSVRTKSYVGKIDPKYIQEHQQTQLYSALVAQLLPELPLIGLCG